MPIANRSFSRLAPRSRDTIEQVSNSEPATLGPLVDWLAQIGVTDHWVVSCYLKLEPRDRTRGKYLIKLKNRSKAQLSWLEEHEEGRGARDAVARDLERIREHLEHPGNVSWGRGIAIFASEPLDLFEAIALPRVFRSRLTIDRSPLVRELAALDDEFGMVLCVVHDRTGARFFRVTASGTQELPGLAAGDTTRAGRFHGQGASAAPGSGVGGEHNFHRRIHEEKHRHYARIADRLFELNRASGVRGIVLAATGSDAGAVGSHLHPYLERLVLGTTKLNPKSVTSAQVMEAVLEVRHDSEREWEAQHATRLTEGLGTGWAVNGIAETLEALAKGQVRTLLVDPTAECSGYRRRTTGRLSLDADRTMDSDVSPVTDVVDEAIEEALRQGSHIEVVEDEETRSRVDGLAALLRFSNR